MSGARKSARSRVGLCAAFPIVLVWVGLGPYFLLCAASSSPASAYAYFSIWAAGVLSDFYTTYRFYRSDPGGFERNELSGYMRKLYRAFGFKAGLAAFLALVEAPVGLIVSFALVPASARVFGLPQLAQPESLAYLSSGFAFLGLGHLAAAAWNLMLEMEPLPSVAPRPKSEAFDGGGDVKAEQPHGLRPLSWKRG